ncbi:PA14 domain-containing protein [Cytophagaceae bacterium YF14B1]|uniref:PA14 domain-containing protein n=1 Tax=Xanthocytophaga flava TaxID=3048013 RepID=A0AAE3U5G8_9BACT|nr:PA14 domain-containing protein [Xanthocytophaga flavus]MDJ1479522.1 PA14 domain-containing protein [Xanthocytophaga flavus]
MAGSSVVTFSNTGLATLNDVTLAAGSTWKFSAPGTTNANGDFTTSGSCSLAVTLTSNTGAQAAVKFSSFPDPEYVNVSNINNTGLLLTILYGVGSNNTNINISSARTLYWVGNSGSWNQIAHWSLTSGGAGGECVPTALDNVVFDANSFTATGQTVALTTGATCNTMTWAGAVNNPTLSMAVDLTVKGNSLILANTMNVSGSGKMILDNGNDINIDLGSGAKTLNGGLSFTAGTSRIITIATGNGAVTHTIGSLSGGSNATINITGTSTKSYGTLSLGTVGGSWAGTNLVSTGTIGGTLSGGLTLNSVTFSGNVSLNGQYNFTGTTTVNSGNVSFGGSGNDTFAGVVMTGGSASFANTGNNNFTSVNLIGTNSPVNLKFTPASNGTNSITGAFTVSTPCYSVFVGSSTIGSPAKLNLTTLQTLNGPTIQDILNSGAALTVNNGVNNGNNTSVTFNFSTAARTLYWVGGTGNWSETAHWSLTSGGAGGQCIPTINDDVNFNAGSFSSGTGTVTIDIDAVCRTMNWTGATNTPTLSGAAARTLTIAGNLTLIAAMNQTGTGSTFLGKVIFVASTTGKTINLNGEGLANVDFNGQGGAWTLSNNLTVINTTNLIAGALNANGKNIVSGALTVNNASDLTRSLNLGTATHTLNGTGTVLDLQGNTSNFTLTSSTSSITLSGAGSVIVETGSQSKTLPNLAFTSSNDITINTSNTANRITFGTIAINNTISRNFTVNGTAPKTYGNFTINGNNNVVTFNGSNSASPNDNIFAAVTFANSYSGTIATFNGTNTFNGAFALHNTGGAGNDIRFTNTNIFANTFTANLANTTATELQFASTSGTTSFTGAVSLNPSNNTNVDIVFNNATSFASTLTIGSTSNTTFQGTGDETFAGTVTVNPSSTFTLNNDGNSSFATAIINSQSGTGFNWVFRSAKTANFSGNMDVRSACFSPVAISSTTSGSRAIVSLPTVHYFNNQVLVQDINASSSMINAYAATIPAYTNNINVLYNNGVTTHRVLYWVGGNGNWGDPLRWSTNSNSVGGACIPTPVDDVVFDNSSFSAGGQKVTLNITNATCRNMTWVNGAIPATTTLAMGSNPLEINGNLALAPNLTMTSTSNQTTSVFTFTTNPATTNSFPNRTITTPTGTTASLPIALFYSAGVNWTLQGPASFNVTGELGLQSGTLKTNSMPVACGRLSANKYVNGNPVLPAFEDRVLDLQNSAISITGTATGIDFRGDKFTFLTPGSNASFTIANTSTSSVQLRFGDDNENLPYYGVNPGSPRTTALLREIPDIILLNKDVDIVTADYDTQDGVVNRITFRKVTSINGGQFYINGTCPHTYGAITVANNLNTGNADQRQIEGSSQAAPNHNIFNGPVSFGTNSAFRFLGNNEFMDTFTTAGSSDVNNAFVFSITNIFNKTVDIRGVNTLRTQATIHFNSTGGSTTFKDNVFFRGTGVIFRMSSTATLVAGKTMLFDDESVGWFAGGNTSSGTGYPIPGSAAYTINGDLIVNPYAKVSFYNKSTNNLGNVTVNDYGVFQFTSLATTNVNGLFTASASCSSWIAINASNPGAAAKIKFSGSQAWYSIIARDLNNISTTGTVTASNSTNVANSCTNISFLTGIPSVGTFVWVGGNPSNTSENSLWSNPKNWATAPLNPGKIANGGSCIPSSINDVVFDSNSFSSGTPVTDSLGNVKYFDRVIVDVSVATCASMTWKNDVMQDAILTSDLPLNEMWVLGKLTLDPKMKNQFTGLFSFRAPSSAGEQFVDANGENNGSTVNFVGPIEVNSVSTVYRLDSDVIVDAVDNGTARRGNVSIVYGDLKANGHDISLTGNWTVGRATSPNPQGRFLHQGANTVTFNGSDAVNGTQNIVTNTSPFWNLVINRGSKPVPTDISYTVSSSTLLISNPKRWVVVQNNRDGGGEPGTTANSNQPYNSGMTIDNNFTITQGGLYDRGFQIIGNATGTFTMTDNAVLSIGNGWTSSGINNNAPMTTLFPTNFTQNKISLGINSIVSYSAYGHQDVSALPTYGNLYFRFVVTSSASPALALTNQRKRLAMGPLQINGNLTLEQGTNLIDNGFQISGNAAGTSVLTMGSNAYLTLGTGAMDVATTSGTGYTPASNITGKMTVGNTATQFPLNFTDANLNLDPNSTIVYSAGIAQQVKGLSSATATQQYGNLTIQNPALTAPTLIQKTLTGATTVRGVLTIHPNSNLVDNGYQITGTTGKVFTMNYKTDPLGAVFNNQAPTSSGVMTNPTSPLFIDSLLARANYIGLRFDGYINIPVAGNYTFYSNSDDQSVVMINGMMAVNNDYYGSAERSGTMTFNTAGLYPISVTYTQGTGSRLLALSWARTTAPTLSKQYIPAANLLQTATGPQGLKYNYYENPGNTYYVSALGASYKIVQDLSKQLASQDRYVLGEARLVVGNASTATAFPLNYLDADLTFDDTTTVVYNAGLAQSVRGLNSSTKVQQYGNLVFTNPVFSTPKVVSKTLTGPATIRMSLTINSNNNLIDDGNQITGTTGQVFTMRNNTLAVNPVTNTGNAGATGESRITLGNATTATTFPANYSLVGTDVNFETGTTVVYNAGIVQSIAGLQSSTVTSRYANLVLTNPATTPAAGNVFPIVKTLSGRAITVRGNLYINPNNTLADGGYQITGTSTSTFGMFNTTMAQTSVPETGVTTGTTGESRFMISSTGTTVTVFPSGFRTGPGGSSDINFDAGTTVIYNANANQNIQGLGGTGTTTYANLVLNNPAASSPALINKTLTTNGSGASGTTVRGSLTINPNVNLVDNGFQLGGVAGQSFKMRNVTLADNLLRTATTDATTIGTTGASRLTLGNATTATTFPTGYTTQNGTDINFELNTMVVYNAGATQQIQGLYNNTQTSNANYAQLSIVNASTGSATKTLTNNIRIRQNLTIGGLTSTTGAVSGANNLLDAGVLNYKIYLNGNWFSHPGNGFNARSGEVELEGTTNQTITTNNSQNYTSEAGTQDFYNLTFNNTTAVPAIAVTLGSNVGVSNLASFKKGLVRSNDLIALNNSPSTRLLIIRDNASVTNVTDASFVIGAVRKVGRSSGTFYFPIGYLNGSTPYYRPSGISSATNTDASFISQFYYSNPTASGFNSVTVQKTTVGVSNPIRFASAKEFWMVNRENLTDNVYVTLTWRNPQSGGVGTNGVATNYMGLRVSRWDGAKWQNLGGAGFTNHPSLGTVSNTYGALTSIYTTSGAVGSVDNFSPFTLATEIDYNPLPVTLLEFAGKAVEQQVNLNWQTASEVNTSYFVVERSQDGKNFEEVTQVTAIGNSSGLQTYQSIDHRPYTGVSYYRLKMVDQDGSYAYSKVIKVNFGVSGALGEITLFPNPGNGDVIYFTVNNADVKIASIHDMLGRAIGYQTSSDAEGTLKVTFSERLAAGTYVAILVAKDGSSSTRFKFVVQ